MPREAERATFDYELPSLGADMDEGRVIEWRVGIGDEVHRGDIIASIETEKSDIDIEIWSDGIVDAFLVDVNALIPVGTPIMRLRAADGANISGTTVSAGRGTRASPLARRAAEERGIDLAVLTGSGPGGAVVRADLDVAPTPPAALHEPAPPVDSMRAFIAERMSTSNREIPHYYLERQVDLGPLTLWLTGLNADRPIAERVLPAAAYIRAVAVAAARHPEVNGFWKNGRFEPGEAVNVAMAISLRRGGLVTPHVAAADEQSVGDIMASLRELVAAARAGSLRASWMTGATITVTNVGDTGADLVHGVISPPQVALVGFGRVADRPWVVDGTVVARPIVTVTLAADHRATDGALGSRFLTTLAELLEHPEEL